MANNALERTCRHRGRAVLAMNGVLGGTAWGRAAGLLPFFAVGALVITGSLWMVPIAAVLFMGVIAYEAPVFHRTPLLPTERSDAVAARSWERLGLVILGVGAVLAIVAFMAQRAF